MKGIKIDYNQYYVGEIPGGLSVKKEIVIIDFVKFYLVIRLITFAPTYSTY